MPIVEISAFLLCTLVGILLFYKLDFSFSSPKIFQRVSFAHQRGVSLGREISALLRPSPPKVSLPEYKWFGRIVEVLLTLQKNFGMPIRPCLRKIRTILIEDVKMERKRLGESFSSTAQFLIISLMTSIFYFCFVFFIAEVPSMILIKVLCFQGVGAVSFFTAERYLHRHTFEAIDRILYSMMKLSVLVKANLPNQKILSLSLNELPTGPVDSETGLFKDNLLEAVEKWKTQGVEISDELDFQVAELGDYRDYKREKFLRLVNALKFIFLCLFFLPSYLYLILQLSSSLMVD